MERIERHLQFKILKLINTIPPVWNYNFGGHDTVVDLQACSSNYALL